MIRALLNSSVRPPGLDVESLARLRQPVHRACEAQCAAHVLLYMSILDHRQIPCLGPSFPASSPLSARSTSPEGLACKPGPDTDKQSPSRDLPAAGQRAKQRSEALKWKWTPRLGCIDTRLGQAGGPGLPKRKMEAEGPFRATRSKAPACESIRRICSAESSCSAETLARLPECRYITLSERCVMLRCSTRDLPRRLAKCILQKPCSREVWVCCRSSLWAGDITMCKAC